MDKNFKSTMSPEFIFSRIYNFDIRYIFMTQIWFGECNDRLLNNNVTNKTRTKVVHKIRSESENITQPLQSVTFKVKLHFRKYFILHYIKFMKINFDQKKYLINF